MRQRNKASKDWFQRMKRNLTIFPITFALLFHASCLVSFGQFGSRDHDAFPIPSGILTRPLERAKQALANEDYASAIEQLELLLGLSDTGPFQFEDYLLFADANGKKKKSTNQSMRQQASLLIAQMPARGRNLFELKYGIAARKKLLSAIRENNTLELFEVSRKYFHTKAGYTATFLLGQQKLEQGDFSMAARYFRRLTDIDAANSILNPELSIYATIALAGDHQLPEAVRILQSLKKDQPILNFELAGEVKSFTISDVDSTEQFVRQLFFQYANSKTDDERLLEKDWLTYRTSSQQPRSIDEFMLPIPEWTVPIDGRNNIELLHRLEKKRLENKLPSMPVLHALAVKDSIIMRTTNGVQAVDVETGKRIWKYPWNDSPNTSTGFAHENELSEDLWSDHTSGNITSDGQKVFFIESPETPDLRRSPSRSLGSNPIFSGTNSLIALKVVDANGTSVEGQLAWRIDAATTTDGDLKDCVFLGPPLVRDEVAYVIIERGGQIRLVAMDANTGKTIWTQQIASTQSRDSLDDKVFRHRMSVTPVFARGLLICPTMVGGLVAVDLTTHSLKWGYRYPSVSDVRFLNDGLSSQRYSWYDDSLFVIDDLLCFSPVDSRSYYVLKAETGTLKNSEPKGKDYFIAGHYEGRLVVVGPESITLDSALGISTSKISLAEFGIPTGLGFFAGQNYYLPISGGKILKADLKAKKVVSVKKTATQLGNLIFYKGRVISQSIQGLDSYWIESRGQTLANRLLQQANDDALGLLLQAQLQDSKGETDLAISSLIGSIQKVKNHLSIGFLSRLLVSKINEGGKLDWKKLDKGYSMLTEPVQRRAYLLAKVESMFRLGEGNQAIDEILDLVDLYSQANPSQADFVVVDSNHSMSGQRLIRTRLRKAVDSLPENQRAQFVAELTKRFDQTLKLESLEKLKTVADIFGELELLDDTAIQIAQRLLEQKSEEHYLWAHALLLNHWLSSSSRQKVKTLNSLIELYLLRGDENKTLTRQRLVAAYDKLSSTIKNLQMSNDTDATKQVLQSIQKNIDELKASGPPEPFDGQAKIEFNSDLSIALATMENTRVHYESVQNYSQGIDKLPIHVSSDVNGNFCIRDQDGILLFSESSRSRGSRHSNSNYQRTHYQLYGDMLILSFGYDHVGIDLSKLANSKEKFIDPGDGGGLVGDMFLESIVNGTIAWRYDAFQYADDLGFTKYARESNSLGILNTELVDNSGNRIGKTTNVSKHGLGILKRDSLVCLDPLTGKTNWVRTQIEPGSDMTGDGTHLFLFAPDDQSVKVYRQLDGSLVGTLKVPSEMVNRIIQNGANVVSLQESDEKILLNGYKLQTDKIVHQWQRELKPGDKASVLNDDRLIILRPDGKFGILDWKTGELLQTIHLDFDIEFSSIQAIEQGSQILLFVNQNSQNKIELKRLEFGSRPTSTLNIDGLFYLLDQEGVRWKGPARIDGYDFVLNQPATAPALLFRKQDRQKNSTELFFVRRSDGSLIDFKEPVPLAEPTTTVRFRTEDNRLTFNLGYNWLELRMSNLPRPPEPPATTGRFASQRLHRKPTKDKDETESKDDDFLKDFTDDFRDDQQIIKKWIKAIQKQ